MADRANVRRTAAIGATLALAAAVGLGAAGGAGAASKSKSIRPTDFAEAIELSIEGKSRDYWTLDHGRSVAFGVRGPGRVKLITRLALTNASRGGRYELVVHEGTTEVARESFRTRPAVGVEGAGFPAWGRHRNLYFDVPPGAHTFRVSVDGDAVSTVAVRPRYLKPRARRSRLSITPTEYEQVLTLVRDEKEISYYLLRPDAPIKVTILGPTVLQVNTRLDFDRHMKGASHGYILEVFDDGESVNRTSYDVTRSQVAVYGDRADVVPGIVKSTKVELDEGLHELEIRLKDTVAKGVAVKLYLPAEDVN